MDFVHQPLQNNKGQLKDWRATEEEKSMRTLLIYPQYPDTFWSFKHALKFIHKKAALPPLGLLTVASMLPRAWPKKLVDLNVANLTEKDLAWADCAFKENRRVKSLLSVRAPA
jgi:hypothetical protein